MHPILLTGAALVGLPILLHLIMRQEPKRQPLPTFRFLKMKQRINERKIRLRHLLLLAMRMLLIALIAFALFQPTLLSDRFNIRGEQPVATIIVLDTSNSMGYILAERTGLTAARQRGLKLLEEPAQGPWTMLDEARARAMELIDDLPVNSKVAIIDSAERQVDWSPTAFDARKKIQSIKKPRGNAQPVSRNVEQAYGMFARLDSAMEADGGPMPRLLVVLSDRFGPSWDPARLDDLKALKDKVPPPAVNHIFLDVGIDKPINLALREATMKNPLLDPRDEAIVNVTVEATGQAGENVVSCRFDGESEAQKKPVNLAAGAQATLDFRRMNLKVGLHTAEIKLETPDALPFDNVRYVTFKVREPRKVLCIADGEPAFGFLGGGPLQTLKADQAAQPFRAVLDAFRSFSADLVRSDDTPGWQLAELSKYEAVALCGIARPGPELWTALQSYLDGGGQVIVFPGGPEMDAKAYNNVAAQNVLAGKYGQWIELPQMTVGWEWSAINYSHPMLAPFAEWLRNPRIDFVQFRPVVKKYWKIEPANRQTIIVPFNDGPNAETRNPAILERRIGERNGRTMQFAMTFNDRRDSANAATAFDLWNNYSQGSFTLVVSNLMLRYMVGETTQIPVNFQTGQMVLAKWPADPLRNGKPFHLGGPEVLSVDSQIVRDPKEAYFRMAPEKTGVPGNYLLQSDDKLWSDGFSLNVPAEESRLDRVPLEQIEPIFGKEGIATVDKELKLREILKGNLTQPVELFPFLMVLLLLFMAFENLLANKFYRN